MRQTSVDRNGTDQAISGTAFSPVEFDHREDDKGESWDDVQWVFRPTYPGVYLITAEVRLVQLDDLANAEMAVFKKGSPDSMIRRLCKLPKSTLSEIQLIGFNQVEMLEGDEYYLAVSLSGSSPSAVIDGDPVYSHLQITGPLT